MEQPETLPGLEPDVRERTLLTLAAALRDFGIIETHGDHNVGRAEAMALYRRLKDEDVLISDPPVETAVSIELVRTSMAMPEQYDVFRDGRQIGYLRLRHGFFRAHYPDHTADGAVYETGVRGDGFFHDDEERARELRAAAVELLKADGVEIPDPQFEIPPYEDFDEDWDSSPLFEALAEQRRIRETEEAERKRDNLELLRSDLRATLAGALSSGASADELLEQLEAGGFIEAAPRLALAGRAWEPTELKPKSLTVVLQPGEMILRADISDFGPVEGQEHNQIVGTFMDIAGENIQGMIRLEDLRESAEVNELFNGYEANELVQIEYREYRG